MPTFDIAKKRFWVKGREITAGQRTMSGQNEVLSDQTLGLPVILTGLIKFDSKEQTNLLTRQSGNKLRAAATVKTTTVMLCFFYYINEAIAIAIMLGSQLRHKSRLPN